MRFILQNLPKFLQFNSISGAQQFNQLHQQITCNYRYSAFGTKVRGELLQKRRRRLKFQSSVSLSSGIGIHRTDTRRSEMDTVPIIDIDPAGDIFKYILLKLTMKPTTPDMNPRETEPKKSVLLVRGYSSCAYHSDIYDTVHEALAKKLGSNTFKLDCLGGGRIKHDKNKLHVYGYSQGFGKADHKATTELLKCNFPDYTITWSDEGY